MSTAQIFSVSASMQPARLTVKHGGVCSTICQRSTLPGKLPAFLYSGGGGRSRSQRRPG
jgi:hypothetical protein